MGVNMKHIEKIILITSSMGVVGFGFLCYMQGVYILTDHTQIVCYDDIGYSNLWIPDLAILVMCAIASTLCLSILIFQGGKR